MADGRGSGGRADLRAPARGPLPDPSRLPRSPRPAADRAVAHVRLRRLRATRPRGRRLRPGRGRSSPGRRGSTSTRDADDLEARRHGSRRRNGGRSAPSSASRMATGCSWCRPSTRRSSVARTWPTCSRPASAGRCRPSTSSSSSTRASVTRARTAISSTVLRVPAATRRRPISVVRDIDLYRLLRAADAHLGLHSTVLTDAVMAGTDNLIARVEASGDLLGYVAAGVARPVTRVADLRAALDHPQPAHPAARRTFIEDHFRPGEASDADRGRDPRRSQRSRRHAERPVLMWKRPIRSAVHLGLDQAAPSGARRGRPQARGRPRPDETPRDDGAFVDRHGVSHPLDLGLRDRLKPEWRSMLDPVAAAAPPSDEVLRRRARKAVTSAREASTDGRPRRPEAH